MKRIPNKVIVWGIDDFNTLGLMRELGQPEIDLLFLIRGKKNIAAYSVYFKQYIETDSIEEGYEYLLSVYKKEKCKPIIITKWYIAVTESYRGKGVAQKLLHIYESLLMEKGIDRYGLSTRLQNHRAQCFYKKCG